MGVASDKDADLRPGSPDTPNDPLDDCACLLAAGSSAGTQNTGDQSPARSLEDEERLVTVLVIVGIEQAQLLSSMRRIVGVVDVENDRLGRCLVGGNKLLNQHTGYTVGSAEKV